MAVMGPSWPATRWTRPAAALGSDRSAGNAAALTPRAASASCALASLSAFLATSATWKPSPPNLLATASEIPGPYPQIMMVFGIWVSEPTKKDSAWRLRRAEWPAISLFFGYQVRLGAPLGGKSK